MLNFLRLHVVNGIDLQTWIVQPAVPHKFILQRLLVVCVDCRLLALILANRICRCFFVLWLLDSWIEDELYVGVGEARLSWRKVPFRHPKASFLLWWYRDVVCPIIFDVKGRYWNQTSVYLPIILLRHCLTFVVLQGDIWGELLLFYFWRQISKINGGVQTKWCDITFILL